MANPKERDNKNVLNNVVLYCCCGFFFILCGYGLYRQHVLEERVLVLEKEFKEFKRTVAMVDSDQPEAEKHELVLNRETRDANECICPAGKLHDLNQHHEKPRVIE